MAVGNLDEGKAASAAFAEPMRREAGTPPRDRPDDARPGPEHAFQALAAVEAAVRVGHHHVSPLFGENRRSRDETQGGRGLFPAQDQFFLPRGPRSLNRATKCGRAWREKYTRSFTCSTLTVVYVADLSSYVFRHAYAGSTRKTGYCPAIAAKSAMGAS